MTVILDNIYHNDLNMQNSGLSAFSLGLIPSLRFVERVIGVIDLLNKPLNVI